MDGKVVVRGALALGAAVAVWQVVAAATIPGSALFVPVAIGLQLVVTVLVLRSTAPLQGYGAQVATGSLVGALASIPIAATSLLVSIVLFPGLGDDIGATPAAGATAGATGTLLTGVFLSVLLAAVLRRRS